MVNGEEPQWKIDRRKWTEATIIDIVEDKILADWRQALRRGDHGVLTDMARRMEAGLRKEIEKKDKDIPRFESVEKEDEDTSRLEKKPTSLLRKINAARVDNRYATTHKDNPLNFLNYPPFDEHLLSYGLVIADVERTDNKSLDWQRIGIELTLELLLRAIESSEEHSDESRCRRGSEIDKKRAELFSLIQQRWEDDQKALPRSTRRSLPDRQIAKVILKMKSEANDKQPDWLFKYLNDHYEINAVALVNSLVTSVSNGKVNHKSEVTFKT